MRIALLSWESRHSIHVGGLAEHVSELAAALALLGHDVHLFTRIADGQPGYELLDRVHYHRCRYDQHPDFLTDMNRMCDSFVWHVVETECFLGAPFDVIHGHDWLVVHAMNQLKHRHGRPLVMTFHSTEFGRCGNQVLAGDSARIRDAEWLGNFIASRVVCVSKALQREVVAQYTVPEDKTSVIYNGVNVRRFDAPVDCAATRRRCDVGVRDPMVLFCGRMAWQKGPDILVEAVPDVLDQHPTAKFVFAGEGDMRAGLNDRASALGLTRSTRFLGRQGGSDLVGLFQSADVVCVPSRNEPFGIVILEAWSARKPVVATRNGGPAEFVEHRRTGISVADERGSIGAGLRHVLGDRSGGERMGRNGRREAETRFTWATIARQTERVYDTVVG